MQKLNLSYLAGVLFVFILLATAQTANAQATLSVQGSLQNFNGTAVDNGQYDITFKLYTSDSGGTPIWSEIQSVTMIGGVYSVHLGEVNTLNIPFDQTYYLGLTIPGGPEHTPRTRLTASPYALSLLGQDNKFPSTGLVKMESVATGQATTTATAYTVAADDHVIFLDHTANQNVTLPAATAANAGRHLMLVNKAAVAKTLTSSSYVDIAGATATTVPATGVVELQSNGTLWRQTGGYVQPGTVGKAFVSLSKSTQTAAVVQSPNLVVLTYTELSDAQNCWNSTTNTFTAPRTGIYHITGFIVYQAINGAGSLVYFNEYGADNLLYYVSSALSIGNQFPFSHYKFMTAGETFQLKVFTHNGSVGFNNDTPNLAELSILEH